jgi:membrane-bound ClpP family serine protease
MEIAIIILLMLIGIFLFLVEIFLIPGISVAGIGGTIFVGGAVFYAYNAMGATAGNLTLAFAIIGMIAGIWIFLRSRALEKMALNTDIDSKIEPMKGLAIKEGDEGLTVSRLAPMGKVKINGAVVEAKSSDDFIDENTPIEVIKVFSTNVLVKRKERNIK